MYAHITHTYVRTLVGCKKCHLVIVLSAHVQGYGSCSCLPVTTVTATNFIYELKTRCVGRLSSILTKFM